MVDRRFDDGPDALAAAVAVSRRGLPPNLDDNLAVPARDCLTLNNF